MLDVMKLNTVATEKMLKVSHKYVVVCSIIKHNPANLMI